MHTPDIFNATALETGSHRYTVQRGVGSEQQITHFSFLKVLVGAKDLKRLEMSQPSMRAFYLQSTTEISEIPN